MVIPRLVISFRENYEEDGQYSQHGGNARQMIQSDEMVFERHAKTDGFELQTVDRRRSQVEGRRGAPCMVLFYPLGDASDSCP